MTQQIIENHFLNVGSSRYQDVEFRKNNADFASISRFGIGILSAFMISDEIEVYTRSAEEPKARSITIRSLNGQYLVRLLDPANAALPDLIRSHGTRIKMRLRAGSATPDVKAVAEQWIIFPGAKVTVTVDDHAPFTVGHSSAKSLLENAMKSAGLPLTEDLTPSSTKAFRVSAVTRPDLDMAIALEWQPAFRNWRFLSSDRLSPNGVNSSETSALGVCIQGIRVESTSPGFRDRSIVAVANGIGLSAPATNVARSEIENGPTANAFAEKIYEVYAGHITNEIEEMTKSRGMSLAEAASEGRFLAAQLPQVAVISEPAEDNAALLDKQLATIPWLSLDIENHRKLASVNDLKTGGEFWTIEGSALSAAEYFLRRTPSTVSIKKLSELSQVPIHLPDGPILSGHTENVRIAKLVSNHFEVDRIEMRDGVRQLVLHWSGRSDPKLWRSVIPEARDLRVRAEQMIQQIPRVIPIGGRLFVLQNSDSVNIEPASPWHGCQSLTQLYLFSGSDLHAYVSDRLKAVEEGKETLANYVLIVAIAAWSLRVDEEIGSQLRMRVIAQYEQTVAQHLGLEIELPPEAKTLLSGFRTEIFNPLRGDRQQQLVQMQMQMMM